MPPLSVDDLPKYRRAINRAVRAWGYLADHVRIRITAALRRAHGTNLHDGFEGGSDIPRSFPEACLAFRQALNNMHAFEDHPSDFPWPRWGDQSLTLDGPVPDIDQWIASLDGMGEDEWRSRLIDPFRQHLSAASLHFQDVIQRFDRAKETVISSSANQLASRLRIDKAIRQVLTEDHEREEADRANRRLRLHHLFTDALNGMTTLNESVDSWAERVTARLISIGREIIAQAWEDWIRENAEGEPIIGGLIDLMLQGNEAGIDAVVKELWDSPHELRHLADWLRSLQHDWSFVFDRGWLWWKHTGDLSLLQLQPSHPAANQQEEQAPASVRELERSSTILHASSKSGILEPSTAARLDSGNPFPGGQRQEQGEMAWDETLNKLRQVLATLYPGPPETRVLLETAGVPTGKILLETPAQTRWHNALREAHLQGNVEAILSASQAEYSGHDDLRAATAAYRAKHGPDQLLDGSGAVARSADPILLRANMGTPPARCDLAVVTAMPEELNPLFRLTGGKDGWRPFPIEHFVHYHKKLDFDEHALDVVAVSLWRYGDTPTAGAVHRLRQLHPRMLAMSGICAGWEGKDGIEFGDVVIAEGGFQPREGKHEGTEFHSDTHLYSSPAWVVQHVKDFLSDEGWHSTIQAQRPRSLRSQGEWLLCQVGTAEFSLDKPDWAKVRAEGIEYGEAVAWLTRHNFIKATEITGAGQALLETRKTEGKGECKPDRTGTRRRHTSGCSHPTYPSSRSRPRSNSPRPRCGRREPTTLR